MGALDNIRDNIVSHWSLEETTGANAVDFFGSNTLVPTNSPVDVAGKINNGKDFESTSSQDYTITDAAQTDLEFNPNTESFTVSAWVKLESKATGIIFAKTDPSGNQYDIFYASGPDKFGWELHGTLLNDVYADTPTPVSTGVFYHCLFWWDHVAQKMKIRIDAGTTYETAKTGTLNTGGTGPVTMGCFLSPGKTLFFDGIIDEVTVWKRVLSNDEQVAVAAGVDLTSQFFSASFDASVDSFARLSVDEVFFEAGLDAAADFTASLEINLQNFAASFDASADFAAVLEKLDKLLVAAVDIDADFAAAALAERPLAAADQVDAEFTAFLLATDKHAFEQPLLMLGDQMGTGASRAQVPGLSASLAQPPRWQAYSLFDLASTYGLAFGEPTGAAPAAAVSTTHHAFEPGLNFPLSAWFNKLWVLPVEVNAGFVTTTQQVGFEVYSSFLVGTHSLDTLINNVDAGITTAGLPGLPVSIPAQSGFLFTVNISPEGIPTISGTLDFNFDLYSILVPFTGSRVRLLGVEPLSPMEERLIWATDLIRRRAETEQRIALRLTPRQEFDLSYSLGGLDRQVLEALLFDHHGRVFSIPVWSEPIEPTADMTAGSDTIQVATTAYSDLRVGGLVAVWEGSRTAEVLNVQSFTSTSITFTTTLASNHARNTTWVYPARLGYVNPLVGGGKFRDKLQEYGLTFRSLDNDVDLSDTSAFPSFNGLPLLDEPNWLPRANVPAALERRLESVDGTVGTFEITAESDTDRDTTSKRWLCTTRQQLWEVRQLLHALKGRRGEFYLPTFSRDLTPVANLNVGLTTLTIERFGYADFVQERNPRAVIWVRFTDGTTVVRTVTGAINLTDTTEQLQLDGSWPSTKTPAEVDRISYLLKVRLQTDVLTIRHLDARGNATIDGPVISVTE